MARKTAVSPRIFSTILVAVQHLESAVVSGHNDHHDKQHSIACGYRRRINDGKDSCSVPGREILHSKYERHRADIRTTIISVVEQALDILDENTRETG